MTREEMDKMSTVDLRKLARARGHRGGAVASARKADLIDLLMGGAGLPEQPPLLVETETKATSDAAGGVIIDALAVALDGRISAGGVDEATVKEIVTDLLRPYEDKLQSALETVLDLGTPTRIEVVRPDTTEPETPAVCHAQYPTLVRMAQARDKDGRVPPIYLHGPAGTGKTSAARDLADTLELDFYYNGAIDSEYKLSGFIDASGTFQSRPFYEAYCHGGVYLFDELDSSLPSAVLAFNSALANGHADFPTGSVERHENCIIIAAGNTSLRGDGYAEGFHRVEMDAAFRDRFVYLAWPLDRELEAACVPREYLGWLTIVRAFRDAASIRGVKKFEVTPRATFSGIALLQAGLSENEVIESVIRKGLDDDQWRDLCTDAGRSQ